MNCPTRATSLAACCPPPCRSSPVLHSPPLHSNPIQSNPPPKFLSTPLPFPPLHCAHSPCTWLFCTLLPHSLAFVGLRDIDAEEGRMLRQSSVHCFTMREVDKHGIAKVVPLLRSLPHSSTSSPTRSLFLSSSIPLSRHQNITPLLPRNLPIRPSSYPTPLSLLHSARPTHVRCPPLLPSPFCQVIENAIQAVDPHGRRPLHLSLDIDGIDPLFAPGTGTCARGGLSYREIHYICEELALTQRLVSIDLVEVLNACSPTRPPAAHLLAFNHNRCAEV